MSCRNSKIQKKQFKSFEFYKIRDFFKKLAFFNKDSSSSIFLKLVFKNSWLLENLKKIIYLVFYVFLSKKKT